MNTFLNISLIVTILLSALVPLIPQTSPTSLQTNNQPILQLEETPIAILKTPTVADTSVPTDASLETPTTINTPLPVETKTPTAENTPFPIETETPIVESTIVPSLTPEPSITPSQAIPTIDPSLTPSAQPTPTNIPVLPSGQVILSLSESNGVYQPGSSVVVRWNIESLEPVTLENNWIIRFDLPVGFTPDDPALGVFDTLPNQFTILCSASAGEVSFNTSEDAGVVVINAMLLAGSTILSESSLTLKPKQFSSIGKNGGEVIGHSGKVKLKFPKDALSEDAEVLIESLATLSEQADISIESAAIMPPLMEGSDGDIIELLAYSLDSGQPLHEFNKKIEIEISYDPKTTRIHPSKMALFYYDEQVANWIPLPSQVNTETNILWAETDHFSLFTIGENQFDRVMIPSIDAAQVSDFTGSASYIYDFEVPSGPGGIEPSISLNYNSQSVEGVIGALTQSSNVGMGWSLSYGGSIIRNRGEDANWEGDDTYSLTIGGTSYQLITTSVTPLGSTKTEIRTDSSGTREYQISSFTDFQTSDASFLKIRRYNWISSDAKWTNESWVVWDKTGGIYRFEERAFFFCACGAGGGLATRIWNWYLTSYQNAAGKQLTYKYVKREQLTNAGLITFEVTPLSIEYPDSVTKIEFIKEGGRMDFNHDWDDFLIPFDIYRIAAIRETINGSIIREYTFGYVSNSASPYPLFPSRGYGITDMML